MFSLRVRNDVQCSKPYKINPRKKTPSRLKSKQSTLSTKKATQWHDIWITPLGATIALFNQLRREEDHVVGILWCVKAFKLGSWESSMTHSRLRGPSRLHRGFFSPKS
jgi:hypothetical protein